MMLISFLDKPNVDIKVKTKVIKKLFDKSISTEAFNLIHLLSKFLWKHYEFKIEYQNSNKFSKVPNNFY